MIKLIKEKLKDKHSLKDGWHNLGVCDVDTGTLMIVDPGYICEYPGEEHWEKQQEKYWDSEKADATPIRLQLNHENGHLGHGVIFGSGYGDGSYLVKGFVEDGRIMKIEIDFNYIPQKEDYEHISS